MGSGRNKTLNAHPRSLDQCLDTVYSSNQSILSVLCFCPVFSKPLTITFMLTIHEQSIPGTRSWKFRVKRTPHITIFIQWSLCQVLYKKKLFRNFYNEIKFVNISLTQVPAPLEIPVTKKLS